MEGAGLSEAITYSLTTTERATTLVAPDIKTQAVSPVRLAMPMSEEHSTLRLSLLPELLAVASYNQARKEKDIALYEVGTVFVSDEKEVTKQPKELNRLAGILNGQWLTHPFQQEHKAVDFYVAKGIVETLVSRLGIDVTFTKAEIDGMHPGRTAEVYHDGQSIGFIGQVHPTLAKSYDLKAVYVFDLDLEYLYDHVDLEPNFNQIPRFPSMSRDIALVMDEMVPSGDVLATIKQAAGEHLYSLHVFDVYQGEHLPAGKKSLAFNLRYLDPARTLTDEEVEASYEAVLAAVKSTHGAVLRA
jgi:phenylalanyl-tRNA synthetase beta chain